MSKPVCTMSAHCHWTLRSLWTLEVHVRSLRVSTQRVYTKPLLKATEGGEVRVPEDAAGVVLDLAVCRGGGGVRVPEDAEGVVHDLSVLTGALPLDATRATRDTALVRFLM